MTEHKIYSMSFSRVYPLYIKKAENKNRTKVGFLFEKNIILRYLKDL